AGYYPTLKMHRLATIVADEDPILIRAEIVLRELRDELDESVTLAEISGHVATYLIVFEPAHRLRFTVKVGEQVRSLYATSAGKALLGSLPKPERTKIISKLKLV